MIGGLVVLIIYVTTKLLVFLQPFLLPVALAGVLAYLLEPPVSWLARRHLPRAAAVVIVFASFLIGGISLLVVVGPSVYSESVKFASALPGYLDQGWSLVDDFLDQNLARLPQLTPQRTVQTTPSPGPADRTHPPEGGTQAGLARYRDNLYVQQSLQYLKEQLPSFVQRGWALAQSSLTGVFGVFGLLFGFFAVPIYLFFFLMESPRIARSWTLYLPLRKSEFRDEVVIVLSEINQYLINFFRGQLVVSMIDGCLVAIGLSILRVQFGFLIGLFLCFLGLMPIVGFFSCYIPALLIAFVQFHDLVHPLWVTALFLTVQQIDGLVVAPRIVGTSVGLHPMTVIFSVFLWTLVLGGLLGAILAVPLTATLKVLLQRYVWERQRSLFFEESDKADSEIEIAT
ncbi:MAG: AI-2E family transporter [Verrucomicrobia bacterium]|nr:AI-2E family transporter [Verrucomicrobiota bacterium]